MVIVKGLEADTSDPVEHSTLSVAFLKPNHPPSNQALDQAPGITQNYGFHICLVPRTPFSLPLFGVT